MTRLDGRVAVVTGAANGVGRAIADRFVAEGAAVLILAIDIDAGNATAKALTSATPIAAERQKRLRRSLSHIGRSAFDRGRACASIESTIVTTTIAAMARRGARPFGVGPYESKT